jgi:hypothetical protein
MRQYGIFKKAISLLESTFNSKEVRLGLRSLDTLKAASSSSSSINLRPADDR